MTHEPFFGKPSGPVLYQFQADKNGVYAPGAFSAVVLPESLILGDWAQSLDAEWRQDCVGSLQELLAVLEPVVVIAPEKSTVRTVRHAVRRKRVVDSSPFPPDTR